MSSDITLGDTIYRLFTTRAFATGIPGTLGGTPVVSAYENDSVTQITAGITLGVDHDSVTGLNLLTLVMTSGNGYESGKDYSFVITTGTVDSVSVVGEIVIEVTISRSAAAVDLANGTDGLSALKTLIDTIDDFLDTEIAAITAAVITNAAGADVAADIIALKAETVLIVADTGELQTDWVNGGRLDLIIDAILVDTGTTIQDLINALNDISTANVNTEVLDVLNTDTITLPGQIAPPLTPTHREAIGWLYKVLRNRKTQTSTLWSLLADNETTVDAKATVSDDGTTAIKQEIVSGP